MHCRHPYVENPQGLSERTNEAAGEYGRACIAVAGECGIPVVDLWNKMQHRKRDYLRSQKSFYLYVFSYIIFCIFLYLVLFTIVST